MTLADMSVITAEVKVDETDIVNVQLGQPADVTVDAVSPAGRSKATSPRSAIRRCSAPPVLSTTQSTTGTEEAKDFKVVVTLDATDPANLDVLRPGLSCTAKVTTARKPDTLTIPIQALVQRDMANEAALFTHKGKPSSSTPSPTPGKPAPLTQGVYSYDFLPSAKGAMPVHKDVKYEFEQYPEDKTEKDLETHVAPAVRHHMMDLLAAIDKRSKPVADIEEGFISTSSCILANLAMKTGRKFTWDAQKQQIVNDPEANKLLARPYRKPWTHPGIA